MEQLIITIPALATWAWAIYLYVRSGNDPAGGVMFISAAISAVLATLPTIVILILKAV